MSGSLGTNCDVTADSVTNLSLGSKVIGIGFVCAALSWLRRVLKTLW